jgi:hypothetical protein
VGNDCGCGCEQAEHYPQVSDVRESREVLSASVFRHRDEVISNRDWGGAQRGNLETRGNIADRPDS